MEPSHDELKALLKAMPEKVSKVIEEFLVDIEKNGKKYDTNILWEVDQTIGGIGGYCMPADPNQNPFPSGEKRSLYRPLQYARSQIDMCDIRRFARNAIENSGMHLEAVCRKYLQEKTVLGSLKYQNTTLGKAVDKVEKIGELDQDIIDRLFLFVKIYNLSKHEINQDESRTRMFNAADALVSYFSVRILGRLILEKTECEEIKNVYKLIPSCMEV